MIAIDTETGTTGWTTTVSIGDTQVLSSPVLANVDRNGGSEVIAVSRAETVTVLDEASGGKLAAYERLVSIYTFPTPADIDAEDDEEVLVRYGDGRVVALEYTS